MSTGTLVAIIGAALAAILAGIGSAYGVRLTGQAAAGVTAEKPDLFGKLLVIEALPGTQGIYGFLVAVIVMVRIGVLGGGVVNLSMEQGWAFFGACLPIAIVGLISAIYQAQTAVSAILMTAKEPGSSAKGITMAALVETYAILALLVSILLVFGVQV
ncbi:MAG: V-type ATP synthase subunit K [Christensenellales bacterium]|jgi:V/A-type H+-transporting ATPase subunit K